MNDSPIQVKDFGKTYGDVVAVVVIAVAVGILGVLFAGAA